jgi:chaperonin cofactor prefoldin
MTFNFDEDLLTENVPGTTELEKLESDTNSVREKGEAYLNLDLENSLDELKCLKDLNHLSVAKVDNINSTAEHLEKFQNGVQTRIEAMRPALCEINYLYEVVSALEETADSLDRYSRRLEDQTNSLLSHE